MGHTTTPLAPSTLNNFYNETNNQDDFRLIGLLAEGNERAVDSLFDKYYSYLCQASLKIVKDPETAEDIVQELFLWLWKNRNEIQINISLKVYLKRAVINRSLNHLRSKRMNYQDESLADLLESDERGAQESLEYDEFSHEIMTQIESLPPQCKTAFKKSRFEDMTYQEIAEEMGLSVKTVGHHIARALHILRSTLAPQIQLIRA